MSDSTDGVGPGFCIGFFLTLAACGMIGSCVYDGWKDDAVRAGKAEYFINPKTLGREWRWKPEPVQTVSVPEAVK